MSIDDGDHAAATPVAADPPATIAAVSLKLLPLWSSDPIVWFQQVGAQFWTSKFDHIVASLSPKCAKEVKDLIIHPPADTPPPSAPHDAPCKQLINRTTASEQETRSLRRCSAGYNSFWESVLAPPSSVRMILASTASSSNLIELAEIADKIMDVASPTVSGIQQVQLPPPQCGLRAVCN
jgi:hypothetical protein